MGWVEETVFGLFYRLGSPTKSFKGKEGLRLEMLEPSLLLRKNLNILIHFRSLIGARPAQAQRQSEKSQLLGSEFTY
jgi:hypothetical protein